MQFRLILCIVLLAPALGHAASSTQSMTFETSGKGVWHPSVNPQFLDDYFIGISDGRAGENDIWDFELPLHPVLPIYGTSSGRVGFEIDLNVDAGSVDVVLPYDAGLSFSYADFSDAPGAAPVRFTPIATLTDDAFMRTYSPDLSFGANFVFEMSAGIRGGGCVDAFFVSGCGSFNESFSIPKQELVLLDIGPDADGAIQVEVLPALQALYDNSVAAIETGKSVVGFADSTKDAIEQLNRDWNDDGTPRSTSEKIDAAVGEYAGPSSLVATSEPLIEVGFKLPQIANTGAKETVAGKEVVQTAVKSDTFLEVDVDVDGLATSAMGIPLPLSFAASVEAGPADVGLEITLADLTLETDFIASQQITITPTLTMDLAFEYADGSTVMAGLDAASLSMTPGLDGLDIGQDFFVDWEGSAMAGAGMRGPLLITPTYNLSAELFNDTDVGFDMGLNLKALFGSIMLEVFSIDVFDADFGPLFDETLPLAGGDLFTLPGGAFELFASSFTGDVITLFPADATFQGVGANMNWSNPANWADSNGDMVMDANDVGDDGNAVVINDGLTVRVNAGDDFEVSNLDIGAGGRLQVFGGTLWQADGPNSRAFTNEGRIELYGGSTLGIFAEVNGGGGPSEGVFPALGCQGCILILNGQINGFMAADGTMVEGPIDLNGQYVVGGGEINATGQFDVDANSLVQSVIGTLNLNLNVRSDRTSINEGRISAAGSTLNWRSSDVVTQYTINNDGGVIEAIAIGSTPGVLNLSHTRDGLDPSTCSFCGEIIISGGVLTTDAASVIQTQDRTRLFLNGVSNEGNLKSNARLSLFGANNNTGKIEADHVKLIGATTLTGEGGVLELLPGGSGVEVEYLNPSSFDGEGLTNGPGHTIRGSGQIGGFDVIEIHNQGTISATGGTLVIQGGKGAGPATFINAGGVLEAGTGGRLELWNSLFDFSGGKVHARGGDVIAQGFFVNGDTSPGGVWHASGGNEIFLEAAERQWASLPNIGQVDGTFDGRLDGAEIILEDSGSDFRVYADDGVVFALQSLDEMLRVIGSDGKLTLINHTFQRGGSGFPFLSNKSESVFIAGHLELVNGTFITDDSNVLVTNEGFVRVNTGGVISGYGKVKSNTLENFGTIIAEGIGKTLQLDGSISGGNGSFVVTDGAKLSLDLGQCGILGLNCSFTRAGSAGPELSGNGFKVESVTAPSELVLWGLESRVDVAVLRNTSVELSGAGARLRMFSQSCLFLDLGCSTTGERTLNQTLELVDASELIFAGGKNFYAAQDVTVANGGTLTLKDSGTAYTASSRALTLTGGSSIAMQGGALFVNSLSLASDTVLEGYGRVQAATITNGTGYGGPGTGIRANDGLLEISNSTIVQDTGGPFGTLEATAIDLAGTERDTTSVLRLIDTSVLGGNVIVGQGALLDGNGSFGPNVNVSNNGTIRIDTVGAGPATYSNTTVTNESKSRLLVTGAKLRLENSVVDNKTSIDTVVDPDTMVSTDIERRANIQVVSELTHPGDSVLELSNSFIFGGDLVLRSQAPGAPGDPQAILQGFGRLNDVNVFVGTHSLIDANVAGGELTFNIGTGSITTVGMMQASNGGILNLGGGTLAGTGDLLAGDNSMIVLTNVNLDGVGLDTSGSGKIVDVATSSFTNLSNGGTFEVAPTGHATFRGNVNNRVEEADGSFRDGTIRVRSGGTLVLAPGTGPSYEEGTPIPIGDGEFETVFVPTGSEPIPFSLSHGTLVVEAGATVTSGGSVFNVSEAILTGNGVVDADAFLAGSLKPGASPGMLDFTGDVTFGALNDLEIELGGTTRTTEYDWFNVGGTLTLGGTLNVVLYDLGGGLFNPNLGDTFDIFDAAFVQGMFADGGITLPGLDTGLFWDISSLATDGVLSVAAVPLPPAVWMFLAGLAGLISVGRRQRAKSGVR